MIIPPLTSQYLNLTKNSSLAVAIAYPEVGVSFCWYGVKPGWQRSRDDFHDDDGLSDILAY